MAYFCYNSKCNVCLHCCDVLLWIVDVYKEIMFIGVQVTVHTQLRYMMTVIFATIDNRNAVQFKLVT